jgi:muramoyltetrapeptide carboxypeptidase
MHKRQLLRAVFATAVTAGASATMNVMAAQRMVPRARATPRVIKPPQLKRGDLIGLIAPSGGTNAAYVEQRVRNLEGFGFRVKLAKNILAVRGNTAGTAAERVADLHEMFTDREVRGIWAVRGGSGASQMLPLIDYGLIRRHPKVFVGFSDITALHLAILKHAGLVSFHGPVASARFTDYSATQLEAVLMHPRQETVLYPSIENMRSASDPATPLAAEFRLRTLTPGVAEGRLIGGNLTVLSALMGTPYAPDWRGAILFLEEIREAPYRIDRMLTQLDQSLAFRHAAGVALGVFRRSVDASSTSNAPDADNPSLTLDMALDDHFRDKAVPAVYGLSFGHVPNNMTLPVGIRARLDAATGIVTLLETAVQQRR